ncbi:MAG: class I SAM-dependent methyltransferase [Chloroflexota bacterium]|nr:class I SAM-dependent methyltransferase [Chloroflexota bacterium]
MRRRDADPAAAMLRDAAARTADGERWWVIGGEAPLALAIADDHPEAEVRWLASDIRHVSALPKNLPPRFRVDHDAATLDIEPASCDVAVLPAPPDRALSRRWLLLGSMALREGGMLLVAGANDHGIRSVIADAAKVFGPAQSEDYGNRQRIGRFAQPAAGPESPAWAAEPGIAPGTWRKFTVSVSGEEIPLVTLPGVFAASRLDAGTRMLLDSLPGALPDWFSGSVLDAGCGAGVIGIAASRLGADRADLLDSSLLAVAAARENVAMLGIGGARVLASDVYDAVRGERYDLIVSNPPFHRGKAVDLTVADRLIGEAPLHLNAGGSLLIVTNAFLAYGKRMDAVFREVETVAATRRYHVIRTSDPR